MKCFRRAVVAGLVFVIAAGSAGAHNLFQSWDHDTNAALLASSQRQYIDLGLLHTDLTVDNSSLDYREVFQEEWRLSFNDIVDELDGNDLLFNANVNLGNYATIQAFRLTPGAFVHVSHLSQFRLPNDLFEILAEGVPDDGDSISREGDASVRLRSVAEAGVHATYRAWDHIFGAKAAAYLPVLYSDDLGLTYDFYMGREANEDGNIIDLHGELSGRVLTAVNFEDPSDFDLGLKIDVGAMKQDDRGRAMYGLGVNNIPLVPAEARYQVAADAELSVTSEGGLQALIDGEDAIDTQFPDADDALSTEPLEEPEALYPETSVSGFYRVDIPYIDVIPHAEFVFGDYSRLNGGVVVQPDILILRNLSVGIAREDFSWQTTAALRLPLRLVEFHAAVGATAPRFSDMFNGRGITASTGLSIGW